MLPAIRSTTTAAASPRAPAARSGGGSFALPDAAEPAIAATVGSSAGLAASSLLGLQEDKTAERVRDRAARRHGRAMLDGIAALQHALLAPGDAVNPALRQLAALAQAVPIAADPTLRTLLADVTLRVQVELARRGH